MTITVDCRMLGASGVGVYLAECLACFLAAPHRFLLLGDREKLSAMFPGRDNVVIADCAVRPFSLRELFLFPRDIAKQINETDVYFSAYFNIPAGIKIPVYTTIHDIIFPDMPELTSKAGLAVRMGFFRRAFRKSKTVFTVSAFSKSRIEYHLGRKTPVVVVYSGVKRYFALDAGNAGGVQKTGDILFAGNIKKHKGLSVLLKAYFMARAEGLQNRLVIAGNENNFRSKDHDALAVLQNADPEVIRFTGLLSHEELKTLFIRSALLVQPSFYEGFGLPPLEAMFCGTRALVSDIPVFKEIYRDFPVVFFHTGDANDLKEKLMDLLHNKEPVPVQLSDDLKERYTYEKAASTIIREMETTCRATCRGGGAGND
ncbi:MAG: glycosyltransferase family 4 protein [Spirochaetaceae bacterium]|nr:glycosyltransferase family 4 protein [Spirochaetaceae bacterium]